MSPQIHQFLKESGPEAAQIVKSLMEIGEGERILEGVDCLEKLQALVEALMPAEIFFQDMGGLAGYHRMVQELLQRGEETKFLFEFQKPPGIDISEESDQVRQAIRWGIESLPEIGEIYPIGGAGDRLNLVDEETGRPRPAAELPFLGKTLFEGLIFDLAAREYLYQKLTGKTCITPIALMTSIEKDNDRLVRQLLENNNWFGRPKSSFFIYTQPLVPVVTREGRWVLKGPAEPALKPGGHGVIWKLGKDSGALSWFARQGRKKVLIRQINNPIAGVDYGLLVLAGLGCRMDKMLGFASCPRKVNATEGMNVLIREKSAGKLSLGVSNVEYTDFKAHGIEDQPEREGSSYSKFPANTNILFVDLEAISRACEEEPLPGKLLNFKNGVTVDGKNIISGRLESTMQNIADVMRDKFENEPENLLEALSTFVTYNHRGKTISVTKKTHIRGNPIEETPEEAYYQLLKNNRYLLRSVCKIEAPELGEVGAYLERGPGVIFLYHPALGPLWSIIGQKIRGGALASDSEMQVDLVEVDFQNVRLEGSFLVSGDIKSSKCVMKNVLIKNLGIDREQDNCYWKNQIVRKEALKIHLEEGAEFLAEDAVIEGDHDLVVPAGHRMQAFGDGSKCRFEIEKIVNPLPEWHYHFDSSNQIILRKS